MIGFAHISCSFRDLYFFVCVKLHFRRHWGWLWNDLFLWRREIIGFSSFICKAPHREIFLETLLFLFIFFPVTVYLLALEVDCLYPFSVQI